ncbi:MULTISPECIES: PsiF family protein [Pseudomonas]|uniref:PsiF family protein n=1 Tax=Pseudomonas TaxID=286 RepID=UPI000C2C525E|nr:MULTISPECIES: PsiF family protein [Pseudomonas putida group]AUA31525.1 phosphate starvation-inducible protein PsiF [Pseudomonas sp. SGAir0191]MBF8725714.1 phosphate starvation-inducible protein PsiF [Pseudomonas putida]
MKRLHIPLLMVALLFSAQGFAANTTQQEKMKTCNADATAQSLKGDARKAFMSTCLKKQAPQTQQEKMKTCNADATAKVLKGDERKAFMSECLKKK